jgi:hypothetical protein
MIPSSDELENEIVVWDLPFKVREELYDIKGDEMDAVFVQREIDVKESSVTEWHIMSVEYRPGDPVRTYQPVHPGIRPAQRALHMIRIRIARPYTHPDVLHSVLRDLARTRDAFLHFTLSFLLFSVSYVDLLDEIHRRSRGSIKSPLN